MKKTSEIKKRTTVLSQNSIALNSTRNQKTILFSESPIYSDMEANLLFLFVEKPIKCGRKNQLQSTS